MTVTLLASSPSDWSAGISNGSSGTASVGTFVTSSLPRTTCIILGFCYNSPSSAWNTIKAVQDNSGNQFQQSFKLETMRTTAPQAGVYQALEYWYAIGPVRAGAYTATIQMGAYVDNCAMCVAAFGGVDSYNPLIPNPQTPLTDPYLPALDFTNGANRPPSANGGFTESDVYMLALFGNSQDGRQLASTFGSTPNSLYCSSFASAGVSFARAELTGVYFASPQAYPQNIFGSVKIADEMTLAIGLRGGPQPAFKGRNRGMIIG